MVTSAGCDLEESWIFAECVGLGGEEVSFIAGREVDSAGWAARDNGEEFTAIDHDG